MESTIVTEQLRELERRVNTLQKGFDIQQDCIENLLVAVSTSGSIPPLINFLNNTDFIYEEFSYNGMVFAEADNVLAEWYGRAHATSTSWVVNVSATESTESIRRSAHASGARTGVEWDDAFGCIALTGGYKIASKMPVKYAGKGNYMAVRMQVKAVTANTIDETIKCRVSIWDNTDNRIIRGTKPTLTSTKIGSHTGGTVTREYILEVEMPDRRKFYSDLTAPDAETNTVSAINVDQENSISLTWIDIIGAIAYRVYRRTPSEADTTWYKIAQVTNGSTVTRDYGGTGLGIWTPPAFDDEHREYHTAEASFKDIGEILQDTATKEISFGIQIPTLFSINGDQFVQIEFLKSDNSATTTTEIPADGLLVDRVGVSYTNGRWCPSAKDLASEADAVPVDPPAGDGGDGDNSDSGEGGIRDIPIFPDININ